MRCRAALESLDSDHAVAAARTRLSGRLSPLRYRSLLRRRRLGRCGRGNQLTRRAMVSVLCRWRADRSALSGGIRWAGMHQERLMNSSG